MSKMVQFVYEKSATDVTNRVGFLLSKPSKNYTVLEITDEASEGLEIAMAEAAIKEAIDRHAAEMKRIQKDFGLSFKYFSEEKVKNMQEL